MSKNRLMKLYMCVDEETNSPTGDNVAYKFTTLANERQRADDLASEKGLYQDEGYVVIIDADTYEVLNKLELLPR